MFPFNQEGFFILLSDTTIRFYQIATGVCTELFAAEAQLESGVGFVLFQHVVSAEAETARFVASTVSSMPRSVRVS